MMLPMTAAVTPLRTAETVLRDVRKIEATKQGTSLRDAITLEREKNQSRDNSRQYPERDSAEDSEHALHLYTAVGEEVDINGAATSIDVVA